MGAAEKLLTLAQAAERCDCRHKTLRRAIGLGVLWIQDCTRGSGRESVNRARICHGLVIGR